MPAARAALGNPGVRAGLASAFLFGAAAPLAQRLLSGTSPWMLAALLYLGSGVGLAVHRRITRAPAVRLPRGDLPWLAGAILAGGVLAPVLLMAGLTAMPASSASLLLTAEGVFTALLAWVVFAENVDLRVGLGLAAILAGAVLLAWSGSVEVAALWPALAVLGACLLWAVDNNLTRRVSAHDATWLAALKGGVAGSMNLVLALLVGSAVPAPAVALAAAGLGLLSYGVSLVLFIVALRHLGTARAGAYFSTAPFVGATLAIALGDPVTWQLVLAGGLMALGVWLHLTEQHGHEHLHPDGRHTHLHYPDAEHRHEH